MAETIDTGALLSHTYELPGGERVVLRYARHSDLAGLRALLAQRGVDPDELQLDRLVRYDPAHRVVLVAVAPLDGSPTVVGVGAIDLAGEAEPETIVADERLGEGLALLLAAALAGRASARSRRVA